MTAARRAGLLALWLPALAAVAVGQGDLEDEDPLRLRFDRLCFYIEEGDALEQERAIEAMIEMGQAVLPLVVRRMEGQPDEIAARYLRVRAALAGPVEADPVPADPATDVATIEKYFRGRFEQAAELFRQGRFGRAQAIVDAILTLEPALPFRAEVLDLAAELKKRQLLIGSLSPHLDCPEFLAWGEPVVLDFFVENVGASAFAFLASNENEEGETQHSQLRVEAELVQYDISGSSHTQLLPLSTRLENDVRIGPEERWSGTLRFDPMSHKRPGLVVARIRIRSWLQVVEITEGTPLPPSGIHFLPVTVTFLHSDYLQFTRDPVTSFLKAVAAGKRREAFLASFLVPRGQYRRVLDEVVARLAGLPPEMSRTLFGILQRWTGERPTNDSAEHWRAWWAARRESWIPPRDD